MKTKNVVSENRDIQTQRTSSMFSRAVSRRTFFEKALKGAGVAFAASLAGPMVFPQRAFAAGVCSPPCGLYCSGCSGNTCPAAKVTCTTSNNTGCTDLCPYPNGTWSNGDGAGLCRDCRVFGPFLCACPSYGLCGCNG